ncbi:thiolase family protein [Nocardioides caldifontis]|uniref:thiolase family protein n=1 Tax=Nocardioides caldifontis TaxID=2588938 RepID=UPI0011DF183E|nr:thiolase family protein [Nocardioides caldifontis]
MKDVVIAGVGIHPFGRFEHGYREMGELAARGALADASVGIQDVDMVFVANVGAEMAKGHNVVDRIGRTGVPVINVEAACASSGSGLFMAAKMVESGAADVVLCLGVEKAPRGFIASSGFDQWQIENGLGVNPMYFAIQAQELVAATDATVEDLADVSVKNHRHAVDNPHAMYRREVTREEVLASKPICPPLTLLMLCAPNEGAAAVVLMSRKEAERRGVAAPVTLAGLGLVSRGPDDWFVPAPAYQAERTSLSARAATAALEDAGVTVEDVDVVECQDTDAASELIAYSDLGLCKPGDEAALLRSGATALGGRIPVNPSGGLLSKGEPLGASGLGQVHELVQQVRGRCGSRQVTDARVGLGHVMGAGHNSCVVVVHR